MILPREQSDLLVEELGESIETVLGAAGVPGTGESKEGECLVAVVSFSGDHIRGAVGVRLPMEVARATHPNPDADHDMSTLADWSAEISNQLLGGLKARLGRRGYNVWISTPVTLTGIHVNLVGECMAQTVSFDEGEATAWVQVSWWEETVVQETSESLMPGEFALF